MGFAVS